MALTLLGDMISNRPRRLNGVSYIGYQRYFLTACAALQRPVFNEALLATRVVAQLLDVATSFEFAVSAYCVMPDHVHALLEGQSERSNFIEFVKRFKQVTGFEFRRHANHRLWQPGYYERILRSDEATEAVVRYILENPIRAGLTSKLGEYAFAGSDRYTLEELISAWDRQT